MRAIIVARCGLTAAVEAEAVRAGIDALIVDDLEDASRPTDFLGMVSVLEERSLCRTLQTTADRVGAVFAAARLTRSGVDLGPFSRPGLPGCFDCQLERERQHAGHIDVFDLAGIDVPASGAPVSHPLGQALAAVAVRGFLAGLDAIETGALPTGSVYRLSMTTAGTRVGRVVASHACARCRPDDEETDR